MNNIKPITGIEIKINDKVLNTSITSIDLKQPEPLYTFPPTDESIKTILELLYKQVITPEGAYKVLKGEQVYFQPAVPILDSDKKIAAINAIDPGEAYKYDYQDFAVNLKDLAYTNAVKALDIYNDTFYCDFQEQQIKQIKTKFDFIELE